MNDPDSLIIPFVPTYTITPATASALMEIEGARRDVDQLPITPSVLASLRETARLYSTHYSTLIEGNQLVIDDVARVISGSGHFAGRERDEREVKGYYAAITLMERFVKEGIAISETVIGQLHATLMANGREVLTPTPYRDGQNIIKNNATGAIIYLPPESHDVTALMAGLVDWLSQNQSLPIPLVAGIAHYQFATIHPWYDGNGRTARLLTTLILHLGGYGLKGLYALEEYYARDLSAYYDAISLGPSHNYYVGRAETDITPWIDYFIEGMRGAFLKVKSRAELEGASGIPDTSEILRTLDPSQRKALALFQERNEIRSSDVAAYFGLQPRTARLWCSNWVEVGFISVSNPSRKARSYRLVERYRALIE